MTRSRAPGRKRWRAGDAQALLEALVGACADPVFAKNPEGVYLIANHAMAATLQLATTTALLGHRDEDILPAATAQTIRSSDRLVMETRAPLAIEETLGERRFVARKFPWENAKGRLLGIVGILEEVAASEAGPVAALEAESDARKRADASLRQMQKMEAIGQLTGGVAHDFNNLLTIILGGLDIIGAHIPAIGASAAATRIARGRDMAMQGARRAATLTQRLLAFSRQQALDPKPLDPNKLVAGMSEFLGRTLGETISLESVLAAGLWKTYIDAGQLENAIVNLAVNARDAMPNGGKLTIETANCHLDETYVSALPEPLKPGQYILIAVADTGPGMAKSTIERVFEPFFTTKEIGKGTGLGLSQVYGFVRQSNGHIKIYSEVGEGTTVKLYLPRYLGGGAGETELGPMHSAPRAIGAETILVVEDDDALREYSVEILTDLGYRVLAASGAAMALEILDRFDDVDLLFTDIVMPGGANGRELADEALHRKSDLKVLFTTGYTRNAIVHHGRLDQGVQMIGKPFSFDQLAAKVRAMLSDC